MDVTLNMGTSIKRMNCNSRKERRTPPLAKEKFKSSISSDLKPITFQSGVQKIKAVVLGKKMVNKVNKESQNISQVVLLATETKPQVNEIPESFRQINDSDLMLNISAAPSFNSMNIKNREIKEQHLSKLRPERYNKNVKLGLSQREINLGMSRFIKNPDKPLQHASDLLKIHLDENYHRRKWSEKKKKTNAPVAINSSSVQQPKALDHVDDDAIKAKYFKTENKMSLFHKMDTVSVKLDQPCVMPIKELIFNGAKVDSLGLHVHAVKNLADLFNITELTTVQQKTIPKALEGKDLIVRSQTGSGKTLAYALPIVEKLQQIRPKIVRGDGIFTLIIVPTRELAIQTYELMQKLLKPYTWLVSGVLIGGESRKSEKARLRKGINILIGTPGRLVDHLLNTVSFKLSKVVFLVLDEADRLLEMGYEYEVQQIVEGIDKHRAKVVIETNQPVGRLNRFLLSATLTPAVQKLAGLTLHEPIFIDNSEENTAALALHSNRIGYAKASTEIDVSNLHELDDVTGVLTVPENLLLSYIIVPPKLRLVTFAALLAKEFMNRQNFKAMVFMSTTEMVNYHHDLFNEAFAGKLFEEDDEESEKNLEKDSTTNASLLHGLRLFKLNGSMTQTERQGVFKGFRECLSGVLLTTDVVCRGIDVPEVNLVVQYSPPHKTADFVHRVGRTARAGRSGRAVLFLTNSELQFVRNLEYKRLRIIEMDINNYLQTLVDADPAAKNMQQAVSNLQHKFQELIADDKELHEKSCKAFVSWIKYYTAFPKELKSIFNIKKAHMGHFAKSFGLKDEPTSFVHQHSQPRVPRSTNRLTYSDRFCLSDSDKILYEGHKKRRLYKTTVTKEVRNKQQYTDSGLKIAEAMTLRSRDSRHALLHSLPKSRLFNISEFGNGLPMAKKRKSE